jgi:LemA protein
MVPLLIVLGVVLLIAFILIGMYNGLVRAKTRVDETWKQIDVRLQNRYDLLPDLIQAVEKATTTDEKILTTIAQVRAATNEAKSTTLSPENADQLANVEQKLNSSMQGLRIAVEAYPELRSQEAIQNFMDQDQKIEEMIAASRQIYNTTAREYNEGVAVFPKNIIAGMFNFKPVNYFEAKEEARNDVGVDWGAGSKIVSR